MAPLEKPPRGWERHANRVRIHQADQTQTEKADGGAASRGPDAEFITLWEGEVGLHTAAHAEQGSRKF